MIKRAIKQFNNWYSSKVSIVTLDGSKCQEHIYLINAFEISLLEKKEFNQENLANIDNSYILIDNTRSLNLEIYTVPNTDEDGEIEEYVENKIEDIISVNENKKINYLVKNVNDRLLLYITSYEMNKLDILSDSNIIYFDNHHLLFPELQKKTEETGIYLYLTSDFIYVNLIQDNELIYHESFKCNLYAGEYDVVVEDIYSVYVQNKRLFSSTYEFVPLIIDANNSVDYTNLKSKFLEKGFKDISRNSTEVLMHKELINVLISTKNSITPLIEISQKKVFSLINNELIVAILLLFILISAIFLASSIIENNIDNSKALVEDRIFDYKSKINDLNKIEENKNILIQNLNDLRLLSNNRSEVYNHYALITMSVNNDVTIVEFAIEIKKSQEVVNIQAISLNEKSMQDFINELNKADFYSNIKVIEYKRLDNDEIKLVCEAIK